MDLEVRPFDIRKDKPTQGQDEQSHTQNRLGSLKWVVILTVLAILLAIAQIVLDSIHLSWHGLSLVKALLGSSIAFLIAAVVIFFWARQTTNAYKSRQELFQPTVNERFTKVIFIGGLILACTSFVLFVNLIVQKSYPEDYATAQSSVQDSWNNSFGDSSIDGVNSFFNASFISQIVFHVFFFLYFLYVSRSAFKCLKWDNQAISQLVFIGCVLLLAFGLGLTYFSYRALGYQDYPQVKAHFPTWNLRSLFFIGIILSALSLLGFLVDHRSWRVGFVVLGFLLLFGLVLLANFTGFAYRHSRSTYNYYKGTQDEATCLNRLALVDANELIGQGCPAKYISGKACNTANRVSVWENYNPHREGVKPVSAEGQPAAAVTEETPAEAAPVEETPAETTPVEEPAETTPAEEPVTPEPISDETEEPTPAETTPAEEPTPAETTPVEEPAEEPTPVEETPAETTPAETTPAEETEGETAPVVQPTNTNTTQPAQPVQPVESETEETEEPTPAAAETTTPTETAETPAETTPAEETEGEETAPVVQPTTNTTQPAQPAQPTQPTQPVESETEETEEPTPAAETTTTPSEETAPVEAAPAEETEGEETAPVVQPTTTNTTQPAQPVQPVESETEETEEPTPAAETTTPTETTTTPVEATPAEETEGEETAPVVQPTTTNTTQPAQPAQPVESETEETEEPTPVAAETTPAEEPATPEPVSDETEEPTPAETTPVEEPVETTPAAETTTTTPTETTTPTHTTPTTGGQTSGNFTNSSHAEGAATVEGETEEPEFTFFADEDYHDAGVYCLNTQCCGILGQVYSNDLLTIANFALITLLAGILILIGAVYFWSVNWIDSARSKGRDYIYLFIMLAVIAAFVVIQLYVHVPLVAEKLTASGDHQ